jgi:hypothetical protein
MPICAAVLIFRKDDRLRISKNRETFPETPRIRTERPGNSAGMLASQDIAAYGLEVVLGLAAAARRCEQRRFGQNAVHQGRLRKPRACRPQPDPCETLFKTAAAQHGCQTPNSRRLPETNPLFKSNFVDFFLENRRQT